MDHIFVTANLATGAEYEVVHVTAEFPDIPSRASDHEPILATITLGEPADTDDGLVGDEADNTLEGGGGNDIVAGGLGNDTLSGGAGNDILRGDRNQSNPQDGLSGGDDTIFGGAGDDLIGGKSGHDSLFGDEGNDILWGDDGDDILTEGLGNDILIGDNASSGAGRDTFVLAVGAGTDTIVDFEVGTHWLSVRLSKLAQLLTLFICPSRLGCLLGRSVCRNKKSLAIVTAKRQL